MGSPPYREPALSRMRLTMPSLRRRLLMAFLTAALFVSPSYSAVSSKETLDQQPSPSTAPTVLPPPPSSESSPSAERPTRKNSWFSGFEKLRDYFTPSSARPSRRRLVSDLSAGAAAASKEYDYIIVGGGAAGCPLARTLADSGHDVLLIERGGARKNHPKTLDIFGTGIAIADPAVSQLVLTTDGVRSHIGAVLSGGTAINMAIIINEVDEYFDYLETFPGVKLDRPLLDRARRWVTERVASPMPESEPYGAQWRAGLQASGTGPFVGYSSKLRINHTWTGASAFDSTNGWYRSAADVLLGTPGVDYPDKLNVLLRHMVHKIEFVKNAATGKLRAQCVNFQASVEDDIAPIVGRKQTLLGLPLPDLMSVFSATKMRKARFTTLIPRGKQYRACVRAGGEIIASAGTILTPILLYKSGLGPKEAVKNAHGSKLLFEIPELGKHIKDRVLVPVGLFYAGDIPKEGFPPRVCQTIGLSQFGPECANVSIGERTMKCTTATAEELGGARIGEGVIYSTRFIFPPEHRQGAVTDFLLGALQDCGEGKSPFGSEVLAPLCPLVHPIAHCFRKVAANFYFTSEPKSEGALIIGTNGDVIVAGNYLTDPQDLQDAMRGVANILRVVGSGNYIGTFEKSGPGSCPLLILNGLLNLVTNHFLKMRRPIPTSEVEPFRQYLQAQVQAYENFTAQQAHIAEQMSGTSSSNESIPIDDKAERELEGAWLSIFGGAPKKHGPYWNREQYATYPPSLPSPLDEEGLKRYALTYMTSIWHWIGSARMGLVVDHKFKVKGVDGLRIVDASTLPQVTRMNPYVTLLAIGRYAGLQMVQEHDRDQAALHSSSLSEWS